MLIRIFPLWIPLARNILGHHAREPELEISARNARLGFASCCHTIAKLLPGEPFTPGKSKKGDRAKPEGIISLPPPIMSVAYVNQPYTKLSQSPPSLTSRIYRKLHHWTYRFKTVVKSAWYLLTLDSKKTARFLESYEAFNHEWTDEEAIIKAMGKDYYDKMRQKVVDYYTVVAHLCALGEVEKMYIPPALDLNANIIQNQDLYEELLCRDLLMDQNSVCLEMGCGRGRISAHMATYSGCASLTGINTDPNQLESARHNAKILGIDDRVQFRLRDMNAIPHDYPDESFDCIYHVAAFSYCKDLEALFKDIYRMLKPGCRFGCLDWVSLEGYNPKDERHQRLMQLSKAFIGAVGTPTAQEYVKAVESAGFKVLIHENPSLDNTQHPLIVNARNFYTPLRKFIKWLSSWHLVPAHLDPLFQRLAIGGKAYLEAENENLCTMSYYILAEKPGVKEN
jgi:sterol 24-C-methyltransferase